MCLQQIEKGSEEPEASLKPAWNALLTEATAIAKVHQETDQRLKGEVVKDVLNWKKNNYKRHMRHWKVTKVCSLYLLLRLIAVL
jgi:hypothetical protein